MIEIGFEKDGTPAVSALVGWSAMRLPSGSFMLQMQTARSAAELEDRPPDIVQLALTENQMRLLGGFLLREIGERPEQARRPGRLRRWFLGR